MEWYGTLASRPHTAESRATHDGWVFLYRICCVPDGDGRRRTTNNHHSDSDSRTSADATTETTTLKRESPAARRGQPNGGGVKLHVGFTINVREERESGYYRREREKRERKGGGTRAVERRFIAVPNRTSDLSCFLSLCFGFCDICVFSIRSCSRSTRRD